MQSKLDSDGYVIVPIRDFPLDVVRSEFDAMISSFPEFKDCDISKVVPVGGGFGALGNAGAFHAPFLRRMREIVTFNALEADIFDACGHKIEVLFDRIMFRRKGKTPQKEQIHRDLSAAAKKDDVIYGGWLNLDLVDQHFHTVPASHDVPNGSGFAIISDPMEKLMYQSRIVRIVVPSGHMLVFNQKLVHEIVATPAKHDMRRVFCAWRITDCDEPLFGESMTSKWINEQGVPLLKSGQTPRMWPKTYANFSANWGPMEKWSKETFIDELVHDYVVKSSKFGTFTTKRVNPMMESLEQIGKKYTDYDHHEKALMCPWRMTYLYPTWKSEERIRIELPSKCDLEAYKIVKNTGMKARKPRVEIEESDSEDDIPLTKRFKIGK